MVKTILKQAVIKILQFEAQLVLKKYKPKVVGVTGSVGKTSTKEAIAAVLKEKFFVGKSEKSYNSEFGVPLTILGCKSAWNNPLGWLDIILHGLSLIIFKHKYPEWLVLEVGADHPGDIKNIVSWVKFNIAVLTRLPEVPVHVEFFQSKEQLIAEKLALVKSIGLGGLVVLNYDDEVSRQVISELQVSVTTYGLAEGAECRAQEPEIFYESEDVPAGLSFKVTHNDLDMAVRLKGVLGHHQIYPALAAVAVGRYLGMEEQLIVKAFSSYTPPPGRLRLIGGIKNTLILDDSYNASPAAVSAALVTLGRLEVKGRKIAALGDMLELGSFTAEAHRQIGAEASEICDLIILVGLRMKFALEAALKKKFPKTRIKHFDDSIEAGKSLQKVLKEGDVVLVKGSQSIRMEKIVEEVMASPEEKKELLVRQELEWQRR